MVGRLLILLAVLPVVEIYLLVVIGRSIGAAPTLAFVLASALIGGWLAKREGLRVLQSVQGSLARGEMPNDGVISGFLVLVGGVLLVIPGVVTDAMSLVLLLPWTRRRVADALRRRLEQQFSVQPGMNGANPFGIPFDLSGLGGRGGTIEPQGTVIDVDVVEKPDPEPER